MPASLHTVIVNLDGTFFFFVDMIRGQGTKQIILRIFIEKGTNELGQEGKVLLVYHKLYNLCRESLVSFTSTMLCAV